MRTMDARCEQWVGSRLVAGVGDRRMSSTLHSIRECDTGDPRQRAQLIRLNQAWADTCGVALASDHPTRLDTLLQEHPTLHVLLAFDESGHAFGYALCQFTITSFGGSRSLNIHDIFIEEAWRGRGIGRAMIEAIERRAREADCAKLTLEVDRVNTGAQRLYAELGFADGHDDSDGSGTWFWRKPLR
ncbi:MAG: GNAT family N-acetyltransferase [Planctomycetota bacterium]|nr:GNAT family N-acetyltransferase [Planctomycetota bacterium]